MLRPDGGSQIQVLLQEEWLSNVAELDSYGCVNSNHQTSTESGGLWYLAVNCSVDGLGWGVQIATKGSLNIQDVQNLVQKDTT